MDHVWVTETRQQKDFREVKQRSQCSTSHGSPLWLQVAKFSDAGMKGVQTVSPNEGSNTGSARLAGLLQASCLVLPCLALSYRVASCLVSSRLISSRLVLSCLVLTQLVQSLTWMPKDSR